MATVIRNMNSIPGEIKKNVFLDINLIFLSSSF